ncbi:hypothetical protein ACFW9N_02570 [Streptomyces sp. NPDC059496]|uniref:hypothetical protein n=2 Tax=unclassified Streptomyces TaxID=2593676 RepID=UPI0036AD461C
MSTSPTAPRTNPWCGSSTKATPRPARRQPARRPRGEWARWLRERKVQIFPDQFTSWFGLNLSTGGEAAALVFPQIHPEAAPASLEERRTLGEGDFMSGATEDRYPDIFGLLQIDGGGSDQARLAVAEQLAELPHHTVALGHDLAANAAFLNRLLR